MFNAQSTIAQLNLFAKGVGIDIQKLITALGLKVNASDLPTAVNTAITANTTIQGMNTALTVPATTTLDMIGAANGQITDNGYKLATA